MSTTNADSPTIIANVQPRFFANFLGGPIRSGNWPFQVVHVEPALGLDKLIAAINEHKSPAIMTGWGSTPLPLDIRTRCPSLKYVCHITGEMRNFLPRQLIVDGLIVTNWGDAISDSVAEGALFLILSCLRRSTEQVLNLHVRKGWAQAVPVEGLLERSVGIHGFGQIARKLTEFLAPLRCRVSAYSPPVPDEIFRKHNVRREESIERLFAENDVIVELEALTDQTRGMVNSSLLKLIRPGGVFVNTGRGAVVNQNDLAEVAAEGKIKVGLDVYEVEPLPEDSPLRGMENVFLTPHSSGPTADRHEHCGKRALQRVADFLAGKTPDSVVTVEAYDRMT